MVVFRNTDFYSGFRRGRYKPLARFHAMLQRVRILGEGAGEKRGGFTSDIRQLRITAAFSTSEESRLSALTRLHDLDSAVFVLEKSGFEDSRNHAQKALDYRLNSFTDAVLEHLSSASDSAALREAALRILENRRK